MRLWRPPQPALVRFEALYCPEPTTGCWLWVGARARDGYGWFRLTPAVFARAHRAAWELFVGPIPGEFLVLHRCDTPACVNPAHLFLGTNAENMADKVAKGRQAWGARHGCATLRPGDVLAARQLREDGFLLREIAAHFGVSVAQVHNVVTGRSWRLLGDT